MDILPLTDCAAGHIKKVNKLSQKALKATYALPCGCEEVAMEDLLKWYSCEACEEAYFYSFCYKEVVEWGRFWHCKACRCCRESREWHCKKCQQCTYGLTLPCEHCDAKSPFMG